MATNNYLAMGFSQDLANALARHDARRMRFNENIDSTLKGLSDATKDAVGFYNRRKEMETFGGDENDNELKAAKDYYIHTGDISQLNTWKQNKLLAEQAATSKAAADNEAKRLAQDAEKNEQDAIREDEQPVREAYRELLKLRETNEGETPELRAAIRTYNDAASYFGKKHPNSLQFQKIELTDFNKPQTKSEGVENAGAGNGYASIEQIKKGVGDLSNTKDAELTAERIAELRKIIDANDKTLGSDERTALNQKINDAEKRFNSHQAAIKYNAEVKRAAQSLSDKYKGFTNQQKLNKVNSYLHSKDKKEQDIGKALKAMWGI